MSLIKEVFKSSQSWWDDKLGTTNEDLLGHHYRIVIIFSFLVGIAYILYDLSTLFSQNISNYIFYINMILALIALLGYSIKYKIDGFNDRYDVSRTVNNHKNFKYVKLGLLGLLLLSVLLYLLNYNYDVFLGIGLLIFSYYYFLNYKIVKKKHL